ncbi:gamma-glutamyltransferase [Roseomonas sp. OT10]|uniref:gamma-glutamyltransferase n=1 Tax=Roseomonas cutis TaxID=2897332 RepID=UPI001E4F270D|nr:gamma-glutamyltransferase [Roseomonas sp. OT10]UFN46918.1 gamma-glutamyltransferase [Roseomonas sp. OT10]
MTETPIATTKRPATGSRGMVVTNHPLGSTAGAEMLAAGGNAVDAAVASLFALTVVEPMMVGLLGGGMAHLRLADGRHVVVDGMAAVPLAATPDLFTPVGDEPAVRLETVGRKNHFGPLAVCAPGTLRAWCHMLDRYGTLPLADVMAPAIRHAERGFAVTPYLADCIGDTAAEMALDPELSRIYLPGGTALKAGDRLVQGDTAETLRTVAKDGAETLHGGALGRLVAEWFARQEGILSLDDLRANPVIERKPVRGTYRGHEVLGPPPPSSGGVHVVQMLNILEGFDLRALGFGSPAALHRIAEAMKIAFADRAVATADPAFVPVPVDRLTDKGYAAERRALIDPDRAQAWQAGVSVGHEGANTTHVTVADAGGMVVSATQTINSLFGARVRVPGVGLIANNYMCNFDPHPGRAQSLAPGKRVSTSMAPLILLRDGKPAFALGLPGGLKIFPSAMQAVVGLLEYGLTLQEAVEAPRIFTQGQALEVEVGIPEPVRAALAAMGHAVQLVPHVGGGMNAIRFAADGMLEGASCWRADGTPIGVAGGLARPGVRFWIEGRPPA